MAKERKRKTMICFACGKVGHKRRNCFALRRRLAAERHNGERDANGNLDGNNDQNRGERDGNGNRDDGGGGGGQNQRNEENRHNGDRDDDGRNQPENRNRHPGGDEEANGGHGNNEQAREFAGDAMLERQDGAQVLLPEHDERIAVADAARVAAADAVQDAQELQIGRAVEGMMIRCCKMGYSPIIRD